MGSLPAERPPLSFAAMKSRKAAPKITTKMVTVASIPKPAARPLSSATTSKPTTSTKQKPLTNGHSRTTSTPRKSSTPVSVSSRQGSGEPIGRLKIERRTHTKRASPAISTPKFTSSDDESERDEDKPRKRVRLEKPEVIDEKRQVKDADAFAIKDENEDVSHLVHAYDIANNSIVEHGKDKYGAFFTALKGDEDECPIIELQYPTSRQSEKFQLVTPTDTSDFKPLDEIEANMNILAEFYLDSASAKLVNSEDDGSGYVQQLRRQERMGLKGNIDAQSRYLDLVNKFNALVKTKRDDGTIAKQLNKMRRVDFKLAEHIIKNQIYARIVSPQLKLLNKYEGFSNNVYGELLPKFLSRIYKETNLKSDQVFVDLGSGVGNCVLQAALEIGCESWGCEQMEGPSILAERSAVEFLPRCRLWGIKPGEIHIIRGDFLVNEQIREVLKRADVVLVNNQAFDDDLNNKLRMAFLDLKEGCQIVSLKPFRSPTHKIKENNVNDPVNLFSVVEKDRWSSEVSWAHDSGKWYHHHKDATELNAFVKNMGGFDQC